MGGLGHGHGHQHENITIDWDRCLPIPYLCSRPEILVESWTLQHYLAPIVSTFYKYIFWKNNSSFQHKMGRAHPRGKMELRAPEDAPEACRACRDVNLFETLTLTIFGDVFQARRDDPYPFSCTRRLTGEQENEQQHTYEYDCEYCSLLTFSDCPRSVEEAKTFILPFLHTGERKTILKTNGFTNANRDCRLVCG